MSRLRLLLLLLPLYACRAQIQHGLDERQANELQAVLADHGVEAKKVPEAGKKPTWAIEVDDESASDAIRILAELGLPRPKTEGFGDVFGKGSLVPTPTEERALYLQALSGEISRTLESVEGVTAARVHIVLPPPARPGTTGGPVPKASAFLRTRPGVSEKLDKSREELKALVAGAVEGLSRDQVTLIVSEASDFIPSKPRVDEPDRMRWLLVGLGIAVSFLAIAMVVLTLRVRHYRGAVHKMSQVPPKPSITPNGNRRAA
jgi:type III secretion protein J